MRETIAFFISLYYFQLAILNATVKHMQDSPTFHLSKRVDSLSHDIDSIKSGMADTGADIEKLNDENKKLEDKILSLLQKNDALKTKVFNLTVSLFVLGQCSIFLPPPENQKFSNVFRGYRNETFA